MILVSSCCLGLAASLSLGALNETVKKQLGLTTGNWKIFESLKISVNDWALLKREDC